MNDINTRPEIPKIGDKIYVGTHLYIDHGEDDVQGGQATVVKVTISGGKPAPFVVVEEHPGNSYDWYSLVGEQEKLKAEFGNKRAYPDPDVSDGQENFLKSFRDGWETVFQLRDKILAENNAMQKESVI